MSDRVSKIWFGLELPPIPPEVASFRSATFFKVATAFYVWGGGAVIAVVICLCENLVEGLLRRSDLGRRRRIEEET